MRLILIFYFLLTFLNLSAQVSFGGSALGKLTEFAKYSKFPSDLGYTFDFNVVILQNDFLVETGLSFNSQKARGFCIRSSSIINVCEESIREKIHTIGLPILVSPKFFKSWEVRPSFGFLFEYLYKTTPSASKQDYREFNPYIQMDWKYIVFETKKINLNMIIRLEHSFLNITKNGVYNTNKRAGIGIQIMFKN